MEKGRMKDSSLRRIFHSPFFYYPLSILFSILLRSRSFNSNLLKCFMNIYTALYTFPVFRSEIWTHREKIFKTFFSWSRSCFLFSFFFLAESVFSFFFFLLYLTFSYGCGSEECFLSLFLLKSFFYKFPSQVPNSGDRWWLFCISDGLRSKITIMPNLAGLSL